MKDWVPLFVAIVWPVTIGIVLFVFRKHVRSLLRSMVKRIGKGAAFKSPLFSVDADVDPKALDSSSRGSCAVSLSDILGDTKGVESVQATFLGVCLEVRLNQEVAESILGDLGNLLGGNGLIPLRRLNEKATAGLLQYPPVALNHPVITRSWVYLQEITMFNRLVDSIDEPSAPDDYTKARISQALTFRDRLKKSGSELLAAIGNEESKG